MDRDNSSQRSSGLSVSRRRMLAMAAAVGSASVAGCGGSGGGGDDTDTQGGGDGGDGGDGGNATPTNTETPVYTTDPAPEEGLGEAVEPTFDIAIGTPPGDIDMSARLDGRENTVTYVTNTPWGDNQFNPAEDYFPGIAANSELVDNGMAWEITFSDGYTWHNGDPVTARDHYNNVEYNRLYYEKTEDEEWLATLVDSFELVDDMTVRYNFTEQQTPGMFFAGKEPDIDFPRWEMEEWLEKMQDATSQSEAESINEDLTNTTKSVGDWVGHGLYQIDEVTDTTITATKYGDHPHADKQNIEEVVMNFYGSDAGQRLAWQNNELDFGELPRGRIALPTDYKTVLRPQKEGGVTAYNMFNEHLQKRKFRQALGYLWDHTAIVQNAGTGFPPDAQTGMPQPVAEAWLPDYGEFTNNAIDYGATGNTEKAASLLQEMGYSKSDGTWRDPDGEKVSFTFRALEWWVPGLLSGARTMNQQLQAFGFEVDFGTVVGGFWDIYQNAKGNWDFMVYNKGPDDINHPKPCFHDQVYSFYGLPLTTDRDGDEERDEHFCNMPWEVTVPENIGDEEVSGSGKTLDLREMQAQMQDPNTTVEEMKSLTEDFAHFVNWYQPQNVYLLNQKGYTGDFENFVFGTWMETSDIAEPWQLALHTGHFRGVEQE